MSPPERAETNGLPYIQINHMTRDYYAQPGRRLRAGMWARLAGLGLIVLGSFVLPLSGQDLAPIDPSLVDPLIEAVGRSNPDLAARRRALGAARARLDAAGFAGPAVLSGEIDDLPGGTDFSGAGFRLEVGKEFLTGGRRRAARALAAAEVRSAEAALYAAERRVWAASIGALTRALGWSGIAARLASEDSLLIGAEESLRGRFAVGGARYTDVLRLRTQRLRIQTEQAEAATEVTLGLALLDALLGEGRTQVERVVRRISEPVSWSLLSQELPDAPDLDSIVDRSGRVRLAVADVERAEARAALVRAEQRPRMTGAIGAQRVGSSDGGFAIGPTLGMSITLPFTARNANRTEAQAAELTVVAARAELDAARATVRADLVAARTRYQAARDRVALFDTALLVQVRQERESALAAYRNGEISLIELLDFERALSRAEVERRRAHIDAVRALAVLISGVGSLEHDDSRGPAVFGLE